MAGQVEPVSVQSFTGAQCTLMPSSYKGCNPSVFKLWWGIPILGVFEAEQRNADHSLFSTWRGGNSYWSWLPQGWKDSPTIWTGHGLMQTVLEQAGAPEHLQWEACCILQDNLILSENGQWQMHNVCCVMLTAPGHDINSIEWEVENVNSICRWIFNIVITSWHLQSNSAGWSKISCSSDCNMRGFLVLFAVSSFQFWGLGLFCWAGEWRGEGII